jgi:hypothetical protein
MRDVDKVKSPGGWGRSFFCQGSGHRSPFTAQGRRAGGYLPLCSVSVVRSLGQSGAGFAPASSIQASAHPRPYLKTTLTLNGQRCCWRGQR